ncbi:hypothetical protein DFH29DRAFT_1030135 [Suillus ampliporus]|nr:hypothetical protein DFH29DRAFT_1030135 [Suillus ampliporus]
MDCPNDYGTNNGLAHMKHTRQLGHTMCIRVMGQPSNYVNQCNMQLIYLISPNTTNMDPGGTEGKQFKDYNSTEQKKNYVIEIINQANMKFRCEDLIDPYNIQPPLDSDLSEWDHKAFKDRRQNELFDSASPFTYYLHSQELTDMSVFIVLFANPVEEDTHIVHWYASKDTPLRDEDMRLEIKTTLTQMFSELAVSVRKMLLSGTPLHFSTNSYANEQDMVNEAMLLALASSIHGPAMEACMLYVHQRGMGVLCGAMGLEAPRQAIRNPLTVEDSQIISETLQYTWATGLLLPQISQDLAMAEPHGPPMPDYAISVYIPFSLKELIFP